MNVMNIEANSQFDTITKSKGGLFDVSDPEMESNIGRPVNFKNPRCIVERHPHYIVGIQKNYKGETVYRVESAADDFGRPASPELLEFMDN